MSLSWFLKIYFRTFFGSQLNQPILCWYLLNLSKAQVSQWLDNQAYYFIHSFIHSFSHTKICNTLFTKFVLKTCGQYCSEGKIRFTLRHLEGEFWEFYKLDELALQFNKLLQAITFVWTWPSNFYFLSCHATLRACLHKVSHENQNKKKG